MPRWFALLILIFALSTLSLGAQYSSQPSTAKGVIPAGSIDHGTYRNEVLRFHYKVPYGWVERTEQMRDPSADPSKSLLLLAIFERPPEAKGESVNSAVVITTESTSAYPGLKTAADYFAPLSEVATGKGFTVVNEPYYSNVGTKKVVRGDFSKKIGDLTMYQSSIVVLEKGRFVSFTFLGGSEDEVSELVEHLQFGPVKAASGTH